MKKIIIKFLRFCLKKLVEPKKIRFEMPESEIKILQEAVHFQNYEPLRNNRFAVKFADIEPWFFKSAKQISDKVFRFELYLVVGQPISEKLNQVQMEAMGEKGLEIKIKSLDPTGETIITAVLESCKITNIRICDDFDYSNDGIMFATVDVSFENKKII